MTQPDTTERRFLHSTLASYASLVVRLGVTFVARMALARLILPEGHGLYEMALRIVTVTAAARDLGLVHHLIRDPRRPYGTVLLFNTMSGVALTVVLMVTAPGFSFLDPELPSVLRVMALWVLLDGLMIVPRTFFERELQIRSLLMPEILRGLTMAVVSVGLAWAGWGVWSFVAGELSAAALFAGLVWWKSWHRMVLDVQPRLIPDLLKGSYLLFLIWITIQLVQYIDIFILGVFTDTETVGYYSRAYWIAFLIPTIVAPRALIPALVEYRDDEPRFRSAFRYTTVFLMCFHVLAGYFLFFNAPKVVSILLGPKWDFAVPLLQVLCFVPFLDFATDAGGEVLKVRHRDRVWLATALLNLASLILIGSWLTSRYGAMGMAWANLLLFGNVLMVWQMFRELGTGMTALLRDLVFVYLAPLPLFAAVAWALPADSWGRLAASIVAGLAGAAILAARFQNPVREFFAHPESAADPGEPT